MGKGIGEMKRIGVVGLCLIAVFASSAIVVASASAEAPEYGRCLKAEKIGKVYNGGYTNSSCTTASESKTGKYEWFPGLVKNKQTTSGGKGLLETVGHLEVACASESSVGEFSGTKEVKNEIVTFKGCEAAGDQCSTTGASAGELVTKPLEGIVGFENKADKKTAFDLYPTGKTGLFIEFACSALTVAVRGSVIVPIASDKMLTSTVLKYKATNGKQQVEHFEGGPNDILESTFKGGPFEQAGQTITTTLSTEEKVELNAVV
jgi:hypothetical protein